MELQASKMEEPKDYPTEQKIYDMISGLGLSASDKRKVLNDVAQKILMDLEEEASRAAKQYEYAKAEIASFQGNPQP